MWLRFALELLKVTGNNSLEAQYLAIFLQKITKHFNPSLQCLFIRR